MKTRSRYITRSLISLRRRHINNQGWDTFGGEELDWRVLGRGRVITGFLWVNVKDERSYLISALEVRVGRKMMALGRAGGTLGGSGPMPLIVKASV